jgi:hypothetical protein
MSNASIDYESLLTASLAVRPAMTAAERAEFDRLTAPPSVLAQVREDPARILSLAGLTPDPWQAELLRSPSPEVLLLCSRQVGKTTVVGAKALHTALVRPSLVLILSASERQASELLQQHVIRLYNTLGQPVPPAREPSALALHLANGSRIIALPENPRTVRTYASVSLLVIDEAAQVPDELYFTLRPMLAVSGGRIMALSTPFGRRGWLYEEWRGVEPWKRVRVKASECPRISADFLARERRALGPRWFAQEYECQFMEAAGAVFSSADIDVLLVPSVPVLEFPQ